jgi:hypothetical protein
LYVFLISSMHTTCPSHLIILIFGEAYKTTGKITFFVYFSLKLYERSQENNSFWTEWQQVFPTYNLLLISSLIRYWFVIVVPKYLNFAIFSKNLLVK